MNHEATTDEGLASFFLHANGGTTTLPRPAARSRQGSGAARPVRGRSPDQQRQVGIPCKDSAFNRRVHPLTDIEMSGPVRGNALVGDQVLAERHQVSAAPSTTAAPARTPWGTYLSGEENWAGYFTRSATDNAARGDKSVASLNRYGRGAGRGLAPRLGNGRHRRQVRTLEHQQEGHVDRRQR